MAKKGVGWRPPGFRAMALERLRNCMHIGKLCEELGVSRSTLGKWRREQEAGREQAPAPASLPGETVVEENRRLKRALAEKVLEVDFLQGALHQVGNDAGGTAGVARGHLCPKPGSDGDAKHLECGEDVPDGGSEPGQFLSLAGAVSAGPSGDGVTGVDPGGGAGTPAALWLPAGDRGVAAAGDDRQPQAGGAPDAGG